MEDLRYMSAGEIEIPAGKLGGMLLYSLDKMLGTLDGVLIDPTEWRVRYFVVQAQGWFSTKRFLLPVDQPTHFERTTRILRIDLEAADVRRTEFESGSVRHVSDADLRQVRISAHAASALSNSCRAYTAGAITPSTQSH